MTTTPTAVDLIKAVQAAADAFIATIQASTHVPLASSPTTADGLVEFDPLHDDLPYVADPHGTDLQKAMCALTYLGSIGRINHEENRGVRAQEIAALAKRAGYADGRVVNGWNSRPNSSRAIENVDGERYLNTEGYKWVYKEAEKLGIKIVGEIAAVPSPQA